MNNRLTRHVADLAARARRREEWRSWVRSAERAGPCHPARRPPASFLRCWCGSRQRLPHRRHPSPENTDGQFSLPWLVDSPLDNRVIQIRPCGGPRTCTQILPDLLSRSYVGKHTVSRLQSSLGRQGCAVNMEFNQPACGWPIRPQGGWELVPIRPLDDRRGPSRGDAAGAISVQVRDPYAAISRSNNRLSPPFQDIRVRRLLRTITVPIGASRWARSPPPGPWAASRADQDRARRASRE